MKGLAGKLEMSMKLQSTLSLGDSPGVISLQMMVETMSKRGDLRKSERRIKDRILGRTLTL